MATNAISLLRSDHGDIEELFRRFEKAGDEDFAEKRRVVDLIIEHLARHANVEEQVFYPALRGFPDMHDLVLEALEEHHAAKLTLSELEKLPANSERFDAKTKVLIESVKHHIEEEESDLFPLVEKHVPFGDLQTMAEAMENVKKAAPTRPHPFAPDQPPLNTLIGLPVAIADIGLKAGLEAARVAGAAFLAATGLDRVTRRQAEEKARAEAEKRRTA